MFMTKVTIISYLQDFACNSEAPASESLESLGEMCLHYKMAIGVFIRLRSSSTHIHTVNIREWIN